MQSPELASLHLSVQYKGIHLGMRNMTLLPNRAAHKLFLIFIALDLIFIGIHVVLVSIHVDESSRLFEILYGRLNIASDRAVPEFFNFGKWFLAVVLALVGFSKTGQKAFLGIGFASVMFLADDALQVHERVGQVFANIGVSRFFMLDAASQGELAGFAFLGVMVAGSMYFAWRVSDGILHGAIKTLIIAIFGMILCGVVFDLVHNLVEGTFGKGLLSNVTGVLEDGGEMLFISLYAATVYSAVNSRVR